MYAELKKRNIRVNLAPEVARSSLFLAAKEISPHMQMDLFGRQISIEMTTSRNCDVLLCDRSVFDILMYTELYFPDNAMAELYIGAMRAFCIRYKSTYDLVFKTTKRYSLDAVVDEIRPMDLDSQEKADEALDAILDEFNVKHTVLDDDPTMKMIDTIITTLFFKSNISV